MRYEEPIMDVLYIEELCVVVTSSITEEQAGLDGIFEFFPKAFEEADENTELEMSVSTPPVLSVHPEKENEIQDRYIKFRKKLLLNLVGFQVSVLLLSALPFRPKSARLSKSWRRNCEIEI